MIVKVQVVYRPQVKKMQKLKFNVFLNSRRGN